MEEFKLGLPKGQQGYPFLLKAASCFALNSTFVGCTFTVVADLLGAEAAALGTCGEDQKSRTCQELQEPRHSERG